MGERGDWFCGQICEVHRNRSRKVASPALAWISTEATGPNGDVTERALVAHRATIRLPEMVRPYVSVRSEPLDYAHGCDASRTDSSSPRLAPTGMDYYSRLSRGSWRVTRLVRAEVASARLSTGEPFGLTRQIATISGRSCLHAACRSWRSECCYPRLGDLAHVEIQASRNFPLESRP